MVQHSIVLYHIQTSLVIIDRMVWIIIHLQDCNQKRHLKDMHTTYHHFRLYSLSMAFIISIVCRCYVLISCFLCCYKLVIDMKPFDNCIFITISFGFVTTIKIFLLHRNEFEWSFKILHKFLINFRSFCWQGTIYLVHLLYAFFMLYLKQL